MTLLALALAATLPTAAPTAGPTPIKIQPGQTITLQVDGKRTRVVAIGAAPPISSYEAEALGRMQAVQFPPTRARSRRFRSEARACRRRSRRVRSG